MVALAERAMPEPKGQKTTPVRLTDEAIKWARIASGYTGESMTEYVSRTIAERGKADAERLHAEATAASETTEKSATAARSRKSSR
jgi:hypothetical protein